MAGFAIVSYNGYVFDSNSYHGGINWNDARGQFTPRPTMQGRMGASSMYLGAEISERTIPVEFTYTGVALGFDDALWTLIGLLDPANPEPRPLVVTLPDGTTTATINATVTLPFGLPSDGTLNYLLVTFVSADYAFKATTPTIEGPTSFAASGSTTFTVGGKAKVNPLIKVAATAPRSSATATVGWQFNKQITFENTGDQSLSNVAWQLGPWDTAALIAAGKMRSDQFDVAIFDDKGVRLRTECIAKNSAKSFVWFTIDYLAAGASRTYDVCYGNSASNDANGFPYYFAGTPAFDINGTDGTVASYAAAPAVTLSAGKNFSANEHVGSTFLTTGGAQIGTYRTVASHTTGASPQLTFSRAPSGSFDATSTYTLTRSGFTADGGTSTGVTATSITDSSQVWGVSQWIGATVETYNAGSGVTARTGTVTANTATALTITAWDGATPSVGDRYRVYARNGKWIYYGAQVDHTGERDSGRWRLNLRTGQPSDMFFPVNDCPGAWAPGEYNPNDANNDFNQRRFTAFDKGGGNLDYASILNASMARKDGANLTDEGYANGVEINIPMGVLGIKHDFQIKNPDGMCKAVFGCCDAGGADWNLYKSYSTTQASLTLIATDYYDLTTFGTPFHLTANLTSDDDADIADDETGTANLTDGSVLEVYLDPRTVTVTDIQTATERNVYDMALTIRRGGSSQAVGDDVVRIGGEDRHVFLSETEELWIGDDGLVPLAKRVYSTLAATVGATDAMTDANGTTLQAHVPTGGGTWAEHSSSGAGDATIDTNRAHNANSATVHTYTHSAVPAAGATWGASDYDVKAGVVMRSDNNLSIAGPCVRFDPTVETGYYAHYTTVTNVWQLFKVVAGVSTQLGTDVAQTLTVDQEYECRLSVRGSLLRLYIDSDLVKSATDTAITAAGRGGLRMSGAATSTIGVHLDNYSLLQGGYAFVREVPNGVVLYNVKANHSGTATRYEDPNVLPLTPGSQTLRVSDEDGNMGTVAVVTQYGAAYL